MSPAAPSTDPLLPGRRAVVTTLAASPLDAVAQLQLEPQAAPEPSSLAPDEVLIAVRSAAVGWVDLLMTSGQYQHVPRPPYTPGLEYAGEVVAAGAAVDGSLLGRQVIACLLYTSPSPRD